MPIEIDQSLKDLKSSATLKGFTPGAPVDVSAVTAQQNAVDRAAAVAESQNDVGELLLRQKKQKELEEARIAASNADLAEFVENRFASSDANLTQHREILKSVNTDIANKTAELAEIRKKSAESGIFGKIAGAFKAGRVKTEIGQLADLGLTSSQSRNLILQNIESDVRNYRSTEYATAIAQARKDREDWEAKFNPEGYKAKAERLLSAEASTRQLASDFVGYGESIQRVRLLETQQAESRERLELAKDQNEREAAASELRLAQAKLQDPRENPFVRIIARTRFGDESPEAIKKANELYDSVDSSRLQAFQNTLLLMDADGITPEDADRIHLDLPVQQSLDYFGAMGRNSMVISVGQSMRSRNETRLDEVLSQHPELGGAYQIAKQNGTINNFRDQADVKAISDSIAAETLNMTTGQLLQETAERIGTASEYSVKADRAPELQDGAVYADFVRVLETKQKLDPELQEIFADENLADQLAVPQSEASGAADSLFSGFNYLVEQGKSPRQAAKAMSLLANELALYKGVNNNNLLRDTVEVFETLGEDLQANLQVDLRVPGIIATIFSVNATADRMIANRAEKDFGDTTFNLADPAEALQYFRVRARMAAPTHQKDLGSFVETGE